MSTLYKKRNLLNRLLKMTLTETEISNNVRKECLFYIDRTLDQRILVYALTYSLCEKKIRPYGSAPISLYVAVNHINTISELKSIPIIGLFNPTLYAPGTVSSECLNHGFTVPLLCPNPLHPANPSLIELCYSKSTTQCYAKTLFPDEYNRQHLQLRIDKFVVTDNTEKGEIKVCVHGSNSGQLNELPVYLSPRIKQRFHEYNSAANTVRKIKNFQIFR